MKKLFLVIAAIFSLCISIKAQVPPITGIWQCSSGRTFQVEANNMGFRYKDVMQSSILQAGYLGINLGVPTFRSNFSDGSFSLFMVKSANKIVTSNSYDPNTLYTWTRQSGEYSNQYQSGNSGSVQYQQKEPRTCPVCNGTRYSNSVVYPPNYGTTTPEDEWCKVCKAYKSPHTHKLCASCGGLGEK